MELLAKLSHKNIVEFVGFVEDLKHGTAWIILSWEANGNVREFLASGNWEIPERISLVSSAPSQSRARPTVHMFRSKICLTALSTFIHANRRSATEI